MKKCLSFIVLLSIIFYLPAQKETIGYPFKGFHVGLVEGERFIAPTSFVQISGTDPVPYSPWQFGGTMGLEVSYNFAHYLGVSVGVNYENGGYHIEKPYLSDPNELGVNIKGTHYALYYTQEFVREIAIPIRLEIHVPLCKNLYLFSETGVSLAGFLSRKQYKAGDRNDYTPFYQHSLETATGQVYYSSWMKRTSDRIRCDLQMGIGAYYHLPYGDLLRLTFGANMSFESSYQGKYLYHPTGSTGTYDVFHRYLYLYIGYFHTFDYERVAGQFKKQGVVFSSNKEKYKKIRGVLNNPE